MKLVFGEGSCGIAAGARKVRAAVEKLNADGAVEVGITGCIGMCYLEPIVDVYGEPGTYPPSEASAEGGSMRGGNGERELREALSEIEHLHVSTCSTRLKSLNPLASLYARFTEKQHAAEIARLLTPPGMKAEVVVVYQTIEDLHKSLAPVPGSRFPVPRIGDWYFTGDYPTPGGYKVLRKALLNYLDKNSERSY